jgi:uncharacterized protein (DUF924 family)
MNFEDILRFWFDEIKPEQRFKKDEKFDLLIISRYKNVHHQAIHCELFPWREEARGRLAEIIVLDQFSRNMFRDDPRSFAYDSLALALAQEALVNKADQQLSAEEKSFLYMPFMHSESPVIHEIALRLYSQDGLESNLEWELKHKSIIDRFGRYPHRNAILGRTSTTEEKAFLQQPGSSF